MGVVEFLGALALDAEAGLGPSLQPLEGNLVATGFAIAEIPVIDALERSLQFAQMQLVVLDAVQLQTTGLLDAGTIDLVGHLVGIGGDSLAGLGVETFFELDDLPLDLALVKGQLVFSHEITHMVCYQSVSQFFPCMGAVCLQTKPLYPDLHQIHAGECKSGRALYQKNAGMQRRSDKECAHLQRNGLPPTGCD